MPQVGPNHLQLENSKKAHLNAVRPQMITNLRLWPSLMTAMCHHKTQWGRRVGHSLNEWIDSGTVFPGFLCVVSPRSIPSRASAITPSGLGHIPALFNGTWGTSGHAWLQTHPLIARRCTSRFWCGTACCLWCLLWGKTGKLYVLSSSFSTFSIRLGLVWKIKRKSASIVLNWMPTMLNNKSHSLH